MSHGLKHQQRSRVNGAHYQDPANNTVQITESKHSGGTEDDFNENTDVVRSQKTTTKIDILADPVYCAKANETIVQIVNTTDGSEIQERVENRAVLRDDGTIVNEKITVRVNTTKIIRTYTISTNWTKSYKIDSVKSVVIAFVKTHAPEISQQDLDMFNSIAATDGNRFASAYNYLQVKRENLEAVVRASTSILKVKISEDDIKAYISAIQNCTEETIFRVTATELIDVNRDDSWTIFAEFYAAKCTANAKAYQLYTYTANKSGAWQDGVITSPEILAQSFAIIRNILKPWLWRYAGMMFDCPESPIQVPAYSNVAPTSNQ